MSYHRTYLDYSGVGVYFIVREVSGHVEKPALMFSGGKEFYYAGTVHLAVKTFAPPNIPFSLVHRYGKQFCGGICFSG
ncbi:MAG: hypothetical protein FDW93_01985 [Bergeyella sp.]|nr:hypothetical protein [Bergeyella sp.]